MNDIYMKTLLIKYQKEKSQKLYLKPYQKNR